MQPEGHQESVCAGAGGMTGSSEPAEYFGMPGCSGEPTDRPEVEGEEEEVEEEEKEEEERPSSSAETCSGAVTDELLPKQPSSQEG